MVGGVQVEVQAVMIRCSGRSRRVLLWHLDGTLPNLADMRIAAHHRALGDQVQLRLIELLAAIQGGRR